MAAVPASPVRRWPSRWQLSLGVFLLGMGLFWSAFHSMRLWSMPAELISAELPEIAVTARYVPSGKQHLSIATAEGAADLHHCDPLDRLCQFVKANSPVQLTVRVAELGPFNESFLLSARAGSNVLRSEAEGQGSFTALKRSSAGGLAGCVAFALLGLFLLWPRRASS